MPAKRIILLEKRDTTFHFALWADVPEARRPYYANPEATSAWKGASGPEVAALQSGAVVERVTSLTRSPGDTAAAAKAEAVSLWTAFQDRITNDNPWSVYGSVYDDAGDWTMTGVA